MLPTPAVDLPGPPAVPRASPGRALVHVLLAGAAGILCSVVAAPLVIASMLGGWTTFTIVLAVVVTAVCALAVALDRTAGPGGCGRPGSVLRGVTLGVLASAGVVGLALVALQQDVGDGMPIPLRHAAAGLPFAAIAGLQWPGVVRTVTGMLLAAATAAVAIPRGQQAAEDDRTQRITDEVGTTAHPWVTEVDGVRGELPQGTGSPRIWTRYGSADGDPGAQFWLFRDDPLDPAEVDPCTGSWVWTPGGDHPVTSCARVAEDTWLRTSDAWQELVRFGDDARVGVGADPAAPRSLLEQALAAARPMTDEEYERWLDEGLTPGW